MSQANKTFLLICLILRVAHLAYRSSLFFIAGLAALALATALSEVGGGTGTGSREQRKLTADTRRIAPDLSWNPRGSAKPRFACIVRERIVQSYKDFKLRCEKNICMTNYH
jgi:hypothetical protein